MLKKYLTNFIRKRPVEYVIIALCEIILIVISLFASCVLMDYYSQNNAIQYNAKYFTFSFNATANERFNLAALTEEESKAIAAAESALPCVSDMRERIYKFCDESPIAISRLTVYLEGLERNSYMKSVNYYPTYDDLVYEFTERYKESWSLSIDELPTKEQYMNHDKVVILGVGAGCSDKGEYVFSDPQHLLVGKNDDEYLIVSENSDSPFVDMFFGSEPDYAKLSSLDFELKEFPTQSQINEIEELFKNIVAQDLEIYSTTTPRIKDLLDIRKEISILILNAFLLLISTFNIMTIFKYMIDRRKKEFAIFRLCGYSRAKAMLFPFTELLGISAVCAVISCFVFNSFKPIMAKTFLTISALFNFEFYIFFSIGFIAITAVLFLIYIFPSLNKSVSDELREL